MFFLFLLRPVNQLLYMTFQKIETLIGLDFDLY